MKSSLSKKILALAALILAQWAVLAYADPIQEDAPPAAMAAPRDNTVGTLRMGDGSSVDSSAISFPADASQVYIRSAPGERSYPEATRPLTYIQMGYRY